MEVLMYQKILPNSPFFLTFSSLVWKMELFLSFVEEEAWENDEEEARSPDIAGIYPTFLFALLFSDLMSYFDETKIAHIEN